MLLLKMMCKKITIETTKLDYFCEWWFMHTTACISAFFSNCTSKFKRNWWRKITDERCMAYIIYFISHKSASLVISVVIFCTRHWKALCNFCWLVQNVWIAHCQLKLYMFFNECVISMEMLAFLPYHFCRQQCLLISMEMQPLNLLHKSYGPMSCCKTASSISSNGRAEVTVTSLRRPWKYWPCWK